MPYSNRDANNSHALQRIDTLRRRLVLRVAVAETTVITTPPQEEFFVFSNGAGCAVARNHAAHMHSLESLDNGRPELVPRSMQESLSPAEDDTRLRHGKAVREVCDDAAHLFKPFHQRRREPCVCVSVAELTVAVATPRVDPATPAQSEAVR
jgi:hypothetical protein